MFLHMYTLHVVSTWTKHFTASGRNERKRESGASLTKPAYGFQSRNAAQPNHSNALFVFFAAQVPVGAVVREQGGQVALVPLRQRRRRRRRRRRKRWRRDCKIAAGPRGAGRGPRRRGRRGMGFRVCLPLRAQPHYDGR